MFLGWGRLGKNCERSLRIGFTFETFAFFLLQQGRYRRLRGFDLQQWMGKWVHRYRESLAILAEIVVGATRVHALCEQQSEHVSEIGQ